MKKRVVRAIWVLLALIAALPILGVILQIVASAVDEARYPPPGALVDVDGGRLHLYCTGPDSARTLVIDVGAGNWSIHWAAPRKELAASSRVCAYDRLGFGWSDSMVYGPLDANLQVTQLHQALHKAGETGPYVLIGHSYGGYLVRLFQARFPAEVDAIVLVEGAHERQWDEIPAMSWLVLEAAPEGLKDAEMMARFGLLRMMGVTAEKLPDERHSRIADAAARTTRFYSSFRSEIDGVRNTANLVSETGNLGDLPLLVVSAGRSAYYYCDDKIGVPCEETERQWDALQTKLVSLSTRGEQLIIPQATHAIQIEARDEVVAAIEGFVGRLGVSGQVTEDP